MELGGRKARAFSFAAAARLSAADTVPGRGPNGWGRPPRGPPNPGNMGMGKGYLSFLSRFFGLRLGRYL